MFLGNYGLTWENMGVNGIGRAEGRPAALESPLRRALPGLLRWARRLCLGYKRRGFGARGPGRGAALGWA